MSVKTSGASYQEACDLNLGWCPDCEDFTRETTEPDAQHYDCPVCGGSNVMGAEWALLCEWIEVEEVDE